MTIKALIDVLNAHDGKFYVSAGANENSVHIRRHHIQRVLIPSKKGNTGDYNYCDVAFAHLYENQSKELFWVKKATNSQHVRGHKCILHIFDNVLSSIPEKIGRHTAKKILDSELQAVVDYLVKVDKTNIKLEDIDFKQL